MTLNDLYKTICGLANARESLILENSLGYLDHDDFVAMYNVKNSLIDLLIFEYHTLGGKRRVDHYLRDDVL